MELVEITIGVTVLAIAGQQEAWLSAEAVGFFQKYSLCTCSRSIRNIFAEHRKTQGLFALVIPFLVPRPEND